MQFGLEPADLALWDEDRGIAPCVARANGLRSNRPENLAILQGLHPRFPVPVLVACGLWERLPEVDDLAALQANWARRFPPGFVPEIVEGAAPSRHYFGFGSIQRIKLHYEWGTPERKREVASLRRDLEPRYAKCAPLNFWEQEKHLVLSGFNRQPIIPYFDWQPAAADGEEVYDLVYVCEGELKAIALWAVYAEDPVRLAQSTPPLGSLVGLRPHKHWGKGSNARLFQTRAGGGIRRWRGRNWRVGVVSLPGIQYAKKASGTWMVAHELDEFLRLTKASALKTVFDNEDKGNPDLPGYHPDVEARFDAVMYALVQARRIGRMDLGGAVEGWFAMLPDEIRDAKGKADWDGVLAALRRAEVRKEPARSGGNGEAPTVKEERWRGRAEEPDEPETPMLGIGLADGEVNPFRD
jgi:hypothetical protein